MFYKSKIQKYLVNTIIFLAFIVLLLLAPIKGLLLFEAGFYLNIYVIFFLKFSSILYEKFS